MEHAVAITIAGKAGYLYFDKIRERVVFGAPLGDWMCIDSPIPDTSFHAFILRSGCHRLYLWLGIDGQIEANAYWFSGRAWWKLIDRRREGE